MPPRRRSRSEPEMLRGSLFTLRRRCGTPTCRCVTGAEHKSPALAYPQGGRTKTLTLTEDEAAAVAAARGTVRAAGPGGRPPAAAVMTAPLKSAATAGFAGSRARFETVLGWLESAEAGTLEHAELEAHLQADARELFRQLYQDHLDLRAEREPRIAAVADAEGVGHGSAEPGHTRGLATVFGPVQVTRIAYRARGQANLHPADGGLNLPAARG